VKSYSILILFATLLMQAQTSPDPGIPCEMWPPGHAPASCYPPDAHPFFHFTVAFCFMTAIALLFAYLTRAFQRENTVTLSEKQARRLSEKLSEALGLVRSLRGPALRKECKVIVSGLLVSVDFTLGKVREYYADHEPEGQAVLGCMAAVLRSGRRLRLYLDRTRTMLRFSPFLSRAFDRTFEAVRQYEELVALVRRCNSKLHDSANPLPILEFTA
jgi:hypothetical protein